MSHNYEADQDVGGFGNQDYDTVSFSGAGSVMVMLLYSKSGILLIQWSLSSLEALTTFGMPQSQSGKPLWVNNFLFPQYKKTFYPYR